MGQKLVNKYSSLLPFRWKILLGFSRGPGEIELQLCTEETCSVIKPLDCLFLISCFAVPILPGVVPALSQDLLSRES